MANQVRYNPDKYPRTEVRETVIRLRATNPELTLQQIGVKVGRSRERVRQILASEAIESRSTGYAKDRDLIPGPPCKHCGTPVSYVRTTAPKTHRVNGRYPTYCSSECRYNQYHSDLTCFYCQKIYRVRNSDKKQRLQYNQATYCSQSCRSNNYWAIAHGERPNTLGYTIVKH